jgi:hypothetical protein
MPGAGATAHATGGDWIVAARAGRGGLLAREARAVGARVLDAPLGLAVASEPVAARLARRLRASGALAYAERDVRARTSGLPSDPLTPQQWWIPEIVPASLTPPAFGRPITVIDTDADVTHPELAGTTSLVGPGDGDTEHGTAVTSVINAPANGQGVVGVWPGQPVVVQRAGDGSCSAATRAVMRAARAHAPVINMSYGFPIDACFSHFVATQYAYSKGSVLVAAAGNELLEGNPRSRPANDPHVLSVGAVGPGLVATEFSNRNTGVDLAAPGVGIPVAVPFSVAPSGYSSVDGTSFAAPIVAAATGWVRRVRPGLTASQIVDVMRFSARDLGDRGWDTTFGWGLVSIERALKRPTSPPDPHEPNDDIRWIDGTHGKRDRPLLRRSARAQISGALDVDEDPVDVIPVWIAPHSRLVVRVRPIGDVEAELHGPGARTVLSARPIDSSTRPGRAVERLDVMNGGARGRKAYVALYVAERGSALDARYTLTARRLRPSG